MARVGIVVKIIPLKDGTRNGKLADAELHFNDGPLGGLRLVGFAIWGKHGDTTNVTLPHRDYSNGRGDKRQYMLLRPQENVAQDRVNEITSLILSAYEELKTHV